MQADVKRWRALAQDGVPTDLISTAATQEEVAPIVNIAPKKQAPKSRTMMEKKGQQRTARGGVGAAKGDSAPLTARKAADLKRLDATLLDGLSLKQKTEIHAIVNKQDQASRLVESHQLRKKTQGPYFGSGVINDGAKGGANGGGGVEEDGSLTYSDGQGGKRPAFRSLMSLLEQFDTVRPTGDPEATRKDDPAATNSSTDKNTKKKPWKHTLRKPFEQPWSITTPSGHSDLLEEMQHFLEKVLCACWQRFR